ncbi:MAG: trigger factor [Lachnospiraceae bacterium]|nr:trigger factor [Lachnospiraceae bacterium]
MNVNVEKLEHNMARFTVEIEEKDFDKYVEQAYKRNKNRINIPGFRRGKVARQVIEKMYGKDFFYGDAANIAIPELWEKVYDESEEDIVSSPAIDVSQLEAGKSFIFTAEAAINPKATLGQYKGLEIEKVDDTVSDEEVEKAINDEREEQARFVAVERPVQNGDQVILDYEGFCDGEAFAGGKGENHPLTIGSGSFIPGFEDQIIGHSVEEDFDVNVTFPEEYHSEALKGKAAVFKCRVHEIKEKQIPELDEDFADDAGFDSVEDYKKDVREKLEKRKAAEARDKKEQAVIEKLVEGAEMDIPDAMIRTEAKRNVDEYAQQLRMQGLSLEQYFMFSGLDEEKMIEQSKEGAEKSIRARVALQAVAEAEGLEVTEEEKEAELDELAKRYRTDKEKIKGMFIGKDEKLFVRDVLIKKAVNFLVENAVEK